MTVVYHILLVDSSEQRREELSSALKDVHSTLYHAADAREAMAQASQRPLDVVIIRHPDPLPVANAVRRTEASRHAVVIVVAAPSDREAVVDSMDVVVDDVLFEPLIVAELKGRLGAHLRRHAQLYDAWRHIRKQKELGDQRARALRLVAHDLNNPLTAIRILAEMVAGEVEGDELQRDLADILEGADLAAAIIESMGAMARLEGADEPLTWFPIDLRMVLRHVAKRPALCSFVRLSLPEYPVEVRGDRQALQQALCDILLNARRLVEDRSAVEVRIEQDEKEYRIITRLKDTSLEEAMSNRLMEIFGAVDVREERIPVAAAGLAFAARTARRHMGRLDLVPVGNDMHIRLGLPRV